MWDKLTRRISSRDEDANGYDEDDVLPQIHIPAAEQSEYAGLRRPGNFGNQKRSSEPAIKYHASEDALSLNVRVQRHGSELRPYNSREERSPRPISPGPSGALGLTLIHCPPKPLFDLIFIHGLGGSSHGTWSYERDIRYFWPPWLAEDTYLSSCRTFTFGYDANFAANSSTAGILDFAKSLLFKIKTFSAESEEDGPPLGTLPIGFVTHSMGGLVAKKAYILGKSDVQYSDLVNQIHSFVFLGTPHRGSNFADTLNNILKVMPYKGGDKQYVADLAANSGALQEINEQFRHVCSGLQLFSFHETQKTSLGATMKKLIVDKESSLLGYPGEYSSSLVANHHTMTKFKNQQDPNYIDVRNALRYIIKELVKDLPSLEADSLTLRNPSITTASGIQIIVSDIQTKQRLQTALGIDDDYDEENIYFRERKMHGTCRWLSERAYLHDWAARGSEASQMLWLTAGPGSGKSTWASSTIAWLKESRGYNGTCQHHFFQGSNHQKRTVAYCLRSIAFQIALAHDDYAARVLDLCDSTGMTFGQQKPTVIWEKLFEHTLFPITLSTPLYWVLDGLDESESYSDLLKLLSKIKSSTLVNILVFSRYDNNISREMNIYLPIRVHKHVTPDDLYEDISDYVRNSMQHVLSETVHRQVIDTILRKAEGSFLWVRLALEKIKNDWHTHQHIMEALTEVPEGMESMYHVMIKAIGQQKEHIRAMATRILTWIVCSFRPLLVTEMEVALSPEFAGFVNLGQTIEDICCQFAVNSNGRITLIHETARVFLLKNTANLSVVIDSALGHEHAAMICIDFLSETTELRRVFTSIQNVRKSKADSHDLSPFDKHPFLIYALFYWSYHVSHAQTDSEDLLEKTLQFLEANLLIWINGIALTGGLVVLIKAVEDLKTFLKRRKKAERRAGLLRLSNSRDEQLDLWATDISRVLGRFGNNILQDPSCVHKYVVPFCPEESLIFKFFSKRNNSTFSVVGKFKTWDDCLARLRVGHSEMATRILCREKFFIGLVGVNGKLVLWHAETFEELRIIIHGEYVSALAASHTSSQLATAGHKTTKLWNMNTGEELLQMPRRSLAKTLALALGANDTELYLATDDCLVTCVDLLTGEDKWTFKVQDDANDSFSRTCPRHMSFSPDLSQVAVVYRGRPVFVWQLNSSMPPKQCVCLENKYVMENGHWNASEKAIWRSDSDHLLILYEDTKIMYWDVVNDVRVQHDHTGARALALSEDGNLLITSDSIGSLSVWTVPEFRLMYRLESEELVVDLAFSMLNNRFCDIRGEFCNVWESDSLIKANEIDDDLSSTYSGGDTQITDPTVSTDNRSQDSVTAICCDSGGKYYCSGFDDGTVSIFDVTDGKKVRNKVMSHDDTTSVIKLVWSASDEYLASADDSSRVIVKRLELPSKQKPKWAVFGVVDITTHEAVEQLLFSVHSDLLLIVCSQNIIVIDVKRKKELGRKQITSSAGSFWLTDMQDPATIVRVEGSREERYQWSAFQTSEDTISAQLNSFSFAPSHHRVNKAFMNRHGVWALELVGDDAHKRRIELLKITRSSSSPAGEISRTTIRELGNQVSVLLGCFQDRLVFLDHDFWVCTWHMGQDYAPHQRHFFLPKYLLSPMTLSIIQVSKQGIVLCPQDKNVIIVRLGLQA